MAWYRTGTISVNNGSATVTGSGTSWIANAAVGEALYAPDGRLYEILSIASNTSLTLGSNYLGANSSGQTYVIVPSQSYIRDLASQAATLVNNYSTIYNTVGQGKFAEGTVSQPSITFATDTDTGFYHSASNEVTFVANGVAQFKYNASGLSITNGINLGGNNTFGTNSSSTLTINGTAVSIPNGLNFDSNTLSIDSTNNRVGFGIASPSTQVAIYNSTSPKLALQNAVSGSGATDGFSLYQDSSANAYLMNHETTPLYFGTNNGTKMTLDSSGNLGLGVTPSAWASGWRALQVGQAASIASDGAASTRIYNNAFYNGTNVLYVNNGTASQYRQASGQHDWWIAPSGTAGNAISFTQAMTLDASGRLGIGKTSPTINLDVAGNAGGIRYACSGGTSNILYSDTSAGYIGTENNFPLVLQTNNSERMRIDSSGNVGIGTSSPGQLLDVRAATTANIRLGSTGVDLGNNSEIGTLEFFNSDASQNAVAAYVRAIRGGSYGSGGLLTFGTSEPGIAAGTATERMRIDSSGNVLVGTTNNSGAAGAGVKLYPNGGIASVRASGDGITFYNTTAAAYRFYVTDGGQIYATNTTISAISDQRFKENVRDLDIGLDAVMALKPRVFDWKEGKGKDIKNDRGFIAQEFEQVFPDLIDEWKDPAPEGEEPYKSVRQDLIPVLVKAIQEQQELINQLTARVAQLEGN